MWLLLLVTLFNIMRVQILETCSAVICNHKNGAIKPHPLHIVAIVLDLFVDFAYAFNPFFIVECSAVGGWGAVSDYQRSTRACSLSKVNKEATFDKFPLTQTGLVSGRRPLEAIVALLMVALKVERDWKIKLRDMLVFWQLCRQSTRKQ